MPSTMMPCFRYRNAHAAIEFLCTAFGFERHAVYDDNDGGVGHAQLTLGDAMVMLGSARDDEFGKLVHASAADKPTTSCVYVVVADPDAMHARAVKAGAKIVMPLEDASYGGRHFSARDPEGQIWSFGSYDPWAT